jgi:hypothetical protein
MVTEEKSFMKRVESGMPSIIQIWLGDGDMSYAREAIEQMQKADLLPTDTEDAITLSLIRLTTLGIVHREFAYLKWDEEASVSASELADIWRLDPMSVYRVATALDPVKFPPVSSSEEEEVDPQELYDIAIGYLVESQRPILHRCLVHAYGSPKKLYERMSKTQSRSSFYSDRDDDEDEEDREPSHDADDDYEIRPGNMNALQYIRDGFQSDEFER